MDLALIAAITLAGALVQGMSGFGFGLVTMSLLPLFLPVEVAAPLVACWGWTLNPIMMWRLRRDLSLRKVGPMLVGGLVGAPLGVLFLKGADPRLVRATLGVVLVAYCVYALFLARPPDPDRPPPRALGALAGLAGGVLGGAFNTAGPPTVVYVNATGWDKNSATAALQAFFLFSGSVAVAGHATAGLLTRELLGTLLPVFPAVWLGVAIGSRIYDRVPQARFRKLVIGMLLLLGVNFLVRAAIG